MNSIAFSKIFDVTRGLLFVFVFAAMAYYISEIEALKHLGFSPVVMGIILGIIYGNLAPASFTRIWKSGILFSAKYLLRLAIIFYGFRITFQNIALVGIDGLIVSIFMVVSTFLLGNFIGKRFLGMDPQLAMLTASGSAVCGAAAVLATESVFKSGHAKAVIAVSTVVLFGTLSMFIYPALYHSGILNMNADVFGIYIGGSIHEVAQVVVAGNAVSDASVASGIIVKMTRVMMLAPLLLTAGFFLLKNKTVNQRMKNPVPVPYFVLGFILVAAINSLGCVSPSGVETINSADTFLLTMSMCALGMETHVSKFKEAGAKPILLAAILFLWLLIGGYVVTKFVTAYL